MKKMTFYLIALSITYTVVCGISWTWALGLSFEWWKLPIVGLLNGVLNYAVSGIGMACFDKTKEEPEAYKRRVLE